MKDKIFLNNSTPIDLPTLIDTRLLIQANSGGGKSWLIRRILEQSHGKVQQIVIDLEGEFSTLREKYDYILAAKNGDIPVETRSAGLLARRLLELNVSAIIDLYELHSYERKTFVRLFLESLINAPKELWHPCLVVVDEAHVFCPEKGQSEAMGSVIDLATRGRKRGFCAILATQRLSKLHKDVAAECNNKLIGRTGLDIDRKRASEELGFTSKENELSLRNLEAGEFYAFGTAISREVIKIKIGEIKTSHPKAGSRILTNQPTPPTDKVKAVLKKLTDLPQEAEAEAKTIADFKKQNADLKRKLSIVQHTAPKLDQEQIKKIVERELEKQDKSWRKVRLGDDRKIARLVNILKNIRKIIEENVEVIYPKYIYKAEPIINSRPGRPIFVSKVKDSIIPIQSIEEERKEVTGGALRMLQVLASRHPMTFTKSQLATLSKLSPRSGTYGTYFSLLKSRGFIRLEGHQISITEEGRAYTGTVEFSTPQTSQEVIEMWRGNLNGGVKRMFDSLVTNYPRPLSREELGQLSELESTSGTFGTYLSMLKSNGLIEINGEGIKASENLFLL